MPGTAGPLPRSSVAPLGHPDALALVGAHDWATTPLGARATWEPTLGSVVDLIMASPVAMALAYGDELTLIYNDAYARLIGDHHPTALGQSAPDVFGPIWRTPGIGDVVEQVRRTGRPFLETETLLSFVDRSSGRAEQAIFTRGHSAVRNGAGRSSAF
jgi:hypothetical protein